MRLFPKSKCGKRRAILLENCIIRYIILPLTFGGFASRPQHLVMIPGFVLDRALVLLLSKYMACRTLSKC